MASVFKPKGKSKYVITYTDDKGRRRKKVGTTDKAVSQRIGRELENRVALRREGLIDAAAESYSAHAARPLAGHLADFRKALEAKNGTPKHAMVTANRAARVLAIAKAKWVTDLSLSKATDALAVLRDTEKLGAETVNHHVRAVKAFSRWLQRDGRARDHTLAYLSTSNPEADRRRKRRALPPAEAGRLVRTAEAGPIVMGMTGPDRARCYALALGTGFRSEEIRTLTPERFDLAHNPPTATVLACYAKNGKEAVQPLPPSLASWLAPWLATLPPERPVFDLPDRTAEMLRVDLAAAGIPYETPSGFCDFHSLRGCYVSYLVSSGASVKTCQTLARHSTPSLTIGIYAKASLHDISGAVDALPDLGPSSQAPEAVAATGTDGRPNPVATQSATRLHDDSTQVEVDHADSAELEGDLKSSGGSPPCGFESHRRQYDRERLETPNPVIDEDLGQGRPAKAKASSRQLPTGHVTTRPQSATRGATRFTARLAPTDLTHPPDLAEVIDAWPGLPESIRAGIVEMVKGAVRD